MQIQGLIFATYPLLVEVDEYVPISVKTFSDTPGCLYYEIGNFKTSYLDVLVQERSNVVRGFTVLSFNRRRGAPPNLDVPTIDGLPIAADISSNLNVSKLRDSREFSIFKGAGSFVVDWLSCEKFDRCISYGRASFYLSENTLMGLALHDLTEKENVCLDEHLVRSIL